MNEAHPVLYTGPETCKAAGVTYRQLDYWDRIGVLSPSQPARGSGTVRGYTAEEIVAVALVGEFSRYGYQLPDGALGAVLSGAPFAVVTGGDGIRAGGQARPRVHGVDVVENLVGLVRHGGLVIVLDLQALHEETLKRLDAREVRDRVESRAWASTR